MGGPDRATDAPRGAAAVEVAPDVCPRCGTERLVISSCLELCPTCRYVWHTCGD